MKVKKGLVTFNGIVVVMLAVRRCYEFGIHNKLVVVSRNRSIS